MTRTLAPTAIALLLATATLGCGDGTKADEFGVGAQCAVNDDCNQEDGDQVCLQQFAGGYCGLEGCAVDADCPEGSACVAHEDGVNYCFRICVDKIDCNRNRDAAVQSNCSSNVVFSDGTKDGKACVPPSS